SKVVIVDRKAEYKTGDIFEIQIASYDWKENKSSFGGDYFVAKLIYEKNNLYPDGISGAVTDHRNGTYSIRIPLLIPGQARLEVRLMIPLKGVADLISCTSSPKYLGTKYVSRYETNETTECNIDFKFADIPKDKICDYSNPRNQEPWFCIKPPSGKCPKITYENFDNRNPPSPLKISIVIMNIGSNRNILGSPIYVTVSPENSKPIQKLPPCATGIGTKAACGYIVDGVWKSTFCDNKIKQIADAKPCFENKEIYFLGDSTTRQHFYFFAQKFGLTAAEAINDDSLWHGPKVATGPGNIRIYYRAHGLPFQNKGPPGFKPYMSDVLDRILPGQDEVLIILNIGLHIMNYEPSLFVHRMLGIREAMLRLNQRRDKVRYIYRSHRMLNNTEFGGRNNGWLLYRYNVIAQQIFQGVENFFYFDVWDFSILWSYKQFHPPQEYLEQESLYLSTSCTS
uniref:NXPE family member 2-like n=1 Tax=Ciona intestinalis TaxID=7719 RepID=H2XY50_CIOIN